MSILIFRFIAPRQRFRIAAQASNVNHYAHGHIPNTSLHMENNH